MLIFFHLICYKIFYSLKYLRRKKFARLKMDSNLSQDEELHQKLMNEKNKATEKCDIISQNSQTTSGIPTIFITDEYGDDWTESEAEERYLYSCQYGDQVRFDPPAYLQRYMSVYETLIDIKWRKDIRKLVDFGCAELKILQFLKQLISVNDIYFVDIDEETLESNMRNAEPYVYEYLKRRDTPLTVSVFCGSVCDPDYHLCETDAVTCVELIEHLYPDHLEALPYNIFSYIHPKLVIITTPNADFNVVFRNGDKLRHYDHKFEWTREQFKDWCWNMTTRFPDYKVTISEIAEGPPGTKRKYGSCSQMAVFFRDESCELKDKSECTCNLESPCKSNDPKTSILCACPCLKCIPNTSWGICSYYNFSKNFVASENTVPCCNMFYKLLKTIEYPFDDDKRSQEEKLIDEYKYRMSMYHTPFHHYYNYDTEMCEIPLSRLVYKSGDWTQISETELSQLLQKIGYETKECLNPITQEIELCVSYKVEGVMDNITSSSEASGYESSDYAKYDQSPESVSDWDDSPTEETAGTSKEKKNSSPKKTCEVNKVVDIEHEASSLVAIKTKEQTSDFKMRERNMDLSSSTLDCTFNSLLDDQETFHDADPSQSNSNKDNILEKKDFVMNAISVLPDLTKIDANRINELDSFGNQNQFYQFPLSRAFTHNLLRRQNENKRIYNKEKDALPGPSNVKRRKKFKITWSPENDEDSPLSNVKSITYCLLENTLNKLDIDDGVVNGHDGLIELNIQEPSIASQEILPLPPIDSNTSKISDEEYTFFNDILESLIDNVIGNVESPVKAEVINDENHDNNTDSNIDSSIGRASREAIFDSNSQVDSLEDFEIPPPMTEAESTSDDALPNRMGSIIIIGVREIRENEHTGATIEGEEPEEQNGSHDEPHFYCQGDGLGVHPSVIAVDINEEEDADSESTSNDTEDFAEVDPGTSEPEGLSLQDDILHANNNNFNPPEPIPETENENIRSTAEYCDLSTLNIDSPSKE